MHGLLHRWLLQALSAPLLPPPALPCLPALPARLRCLACLQKKVEYVLQKAGAKGQLAIIGFLILTLIILIFLLLA